MTSARKSKQEAGGHSAACCTDVFGKKKGAGTSDGITQAFDAYLETAFAPGKLDAKTKELINFALVVMARCRPCIELHLQEALDMGISRGELDEAAWCATAMGGAPVRMFYQEVLERRKSGGGKCC